MGAGEVPSEGDVPIVLKVYPRRQDMGDRFNGCQTTWTYGLELDGRHELVLKTRTYYSRGKALASDSTGVGGRIQCRYAEDGSLVSGKRPNCPISADILVPARSMAAGCASDAQRSRSCKFD